ncbi:MAG: STAS domain-containing protein [bacterium]|jgi:anti-anti-sigma factor|nr:STAS domain-containing protein [bacterium]
MKLEQIIRDDVIVFNILGRVEYEDVDEFQHAVKNLIQETPENGSSRKVVINLEQTEFMNSVGLGCIINLANDIRAVGGDLKLARPNRELARLFDVVNLVKNFEIYNSIEAAVDSF